MNWQSILMIIGLITIIMALIKHAFNLVKYVLIGIVVMQIGFLLSQTSFNNLINLKEIFKYDVFSAIGKVFSGTIIEDVLTTIGQFLSKIILFVVNLIEQIFGGEIKSWDTLIK